MQRWLSLSSLVFTYHFSSDSLRYSYRSWLQHFPSLPVRIREEKRSLLLLLFLLICFYDTGTKRRRRRRPSRGKEMKCVNASKMSSAALGGRKERDQLVGTGRYHATRHESRPSSSIPIKAQSLVLLQFRARLSLASQMLSPRTRLYQ